MRHVPVGGEFVSIRGEVVAGYETFALHSDACQTDNRTGALIWLETKPPDDFPYAPTSVTGPQFLKAEREGTVAKLVSSIEFVSPQPVAFHSDHAWQELQRELDKHGAAVATLFGRLDGGGNRFVKKPDGSVYLAGGYGHGSSFSRRLVIERVKEVTSGRR